MAGGEDQPGTPPSRSRLEEEQSLFRNDNPTDTGGWESTSQVSPLPSVSGEYRILRPLGGGSMAELYIAEKVTSFGAVHRAVIKQAKRSRPDYTELTRMLLDEARAMALLDHPNIVHLYDVKETERGLSLALEFVDGTDLRRVNDNLRRRKEALPFELAAFTVGEVLRGLHHAHVATDPGGTVLGLIHRDVNPSNVLVARTGHVKLADFGVALMRDRVQHKTEPGLVKGKYAYLAPEYIAGEPCTIQSDVYAAGVMLFELLSGRECFGGTTAYEVMWKIVNKGVPMYRLSREGVPEDLQRIVQKATAMVPERRYSSAQDMANSLEAWRMRSGRHATSWVLSVFFNRHELFPPPIREPAALAAKTEQPIQKVPTADLVPKPAAQPTPTAPVTPSRVNTPPPSEFELPILPAEPITQPTVAGHPDEFATPTPEPIRVRAPLPLDVASARPMPTPVPTPLPTALEMAAFESGEELPRGTPPALRVAASESFASPMEAARKVGPSTRDIESSVEVEAEVVFGRGKLEDTAAVQVLARAIEEEATGIIEFRCGLIWKRVIVVKGKPTGITSNMGMELIGEHLVKNRIISRADLDRALKASEQRQRPLTVMMLEQGALNRSTLEVELGRNLTARLGEVLEWRWGTFEYKPQDIEAPDILPKMDLDALLTQSGDRRKDPSGKTEVPAPNADAPPERQLSEALKVARSISKGGGKRVERPWRSK